MRKSLFLMSLLATGGLATSTFAQLVLEQVEEGVRVSPVAIAKIDEFGNILGDWIEWNEPGVAEDCGGWLCYDAVGTDTRTQFPGDGFYGLNCGLGSARFKFSDTTQDRVFVEDFTAQGGCNAADFGRIEHAWWWQVGGTGTSEQCVIFISMLENWESSGNCTSGGFVDGVAVAFGVLPSSKDVGYYVADLGLCATSANVLGPADGSGAYKVVYAKDEFGTLATTAQPMLWGDNQPLNEGNNGKRHHSDLDNDGVIDSGECKNNDLGNCMNPLCAMTSFWKAGTPTSPKLRANCRNGTMSARAKNFGPAGTRVTFKLDGGPNNNQIVRPSGRCNVEFTGLPSGSPHTVSATSDVVGATLFRNTSCN